MPWPRRTCRVAYDTMAVGACPTRGQGPANRVGGYLAGLVLGAFRRCARLGRIWPRRKSPVRCSTSPAWTSRPSCRCGGWADQPA
jgi:hypothetical protein